MDKQTSHEKITHDDIDVNLNTQKRKMILRQDRIQTLPGEAHIQIQNITFPVLNFSSFGLAIESDTEMVFGTELFDVTFVFRDVQIATLNLKVVRTEKRPNSYLMGIDILGEPIHLEKIEGVKLASRVIEAHNSHFEHERLVPDKIKKDIYELEDWLNKLQHHVSQIENTLPVSSSTTLTLTESSFIDVISSYIGHEFPAKYKLLGDKLRDLNPEQMKASIEFFRSKLKDIIYQSPFSDRVYHKPLGYAGDYEMMNLIYKRENVGPNLFAKCLHRYWIDEPSAQAVRNRTGFIKDKIKSLCKTHTDKDKLEILSVACGPALEIQEFIKEDYSHKQSVEFSLLDQDIEALKHAKTQLRLGMNSNNNGRMHFNYLHMAIKNVIGRGLEKDKYDLVYSIGLFDYLSDPVAQLAASKLFRSLKAGGTLIIGNFNIGNPNFHMMNLGLDWQLIYRSEADLNQLFDHVGGPIEIEKEELGINLFCSVSKTQ